MKFDTFDFDVKNNFYEIFTTFLAQSVLKIKNAQKLLKFETVDIWICCQSQIFQMLSKMIFVKNLPPVRAKLVPKLKVLRVYWNLAQLIFRIFRSRFWFQKLFLLNTYNLFGPNWSQNEKCSEFIEIWHIRFWCRKWFLSKIYHLLDPNWLQN